MPICRKRAKKKPEARILISGDLQELEAIFHAARECEPDKVASYLDSACKGDKLLRATIEALLDSHRQATDFIETPPVALATWAVKSDVTNSPVGRTIGHYKVIELLSRGGMGEAYLALDTKGERKAVLKLLPARFTANSARVSRFQQEARSVIALNHPNIVTIYEIGEEDSTYYIASELVEGETLRHRLLRGRMPLVEVVEIGVQIASALTAAHKASVVHRDIKPENIMLRDDGYVKVLDFGIAKLAQPDLVEPSLNEQSTVTAQTSFGSAIGTLRYMSPEQVRGETMDARTDIWSLGVVLYEMAAGVMPFAGQTVEETSWAIQHTAPAALSGQRTRLITELQQMILRALQKDRAQRYASMGAMLESLKQLRRRIETKVQPSRRWRLPLTLAAAFVAFAAIFVVIRSQINERVATRAPKSIAVLPFENKDARKDEHYFSEGIEKELVGQLSRIGGLKVVSAASTERFASGERNLKKIAKQLGVTYLLEGSLQRTVGRIALDLRLSDASTQAQLWSEKYERSLDDVFALESEITTKIAARLGAALSDSNRSALAAAPTVSSEAHQLYLRGRDLAEKRDEQDLKKAIEFYEEAIGKDPNYALAYSGLAEAYVLLPSWGNQTPIQHYYGLSRTAAERAVALDPMLPEAHIALGFVVLYEDRDFARARQELERAVALSPNSATAHYYLGYSIFTPLGDFDHAIPEMKRAVELDPLSPIVSGNFGMCYLLARRYPEGLAQLQKALAVNPTVVFLYDGLGWALTLNGQLDEAIETWKHSYDTGHHYHALAELAYGYATKGDRDQALKVVSQLRDLEQHGTRVWTLGHAYIELALGNKEQAMQWLERGATEGESTIINYIKVLPLLDPLRGEPRFERLVSELVPPGGTMVESTPASNAPLLTKTGDEAGKEGAVFYGTNLLINGNAEEGPASPGAESVPVPGWQTTGEFTVVSYGAPGGYPAIGDTPPSGMKQFFAGGRSDVSTATQEIDLSANARDIDTGRVMCDVSAWLGGYSDQEDSAKLAIEFRSNTAVNLKSITLGPVTALERSNQTGLRFRSSSLPVPAKTRRIHAELILTRKSDAGPWNDGYADNLSIILHGLDGR